MRLSVVHLLEHQDAVIPRVLHSSVYCGNIFLDSDLAPLRLLVVSMYNGRQWLAVFHPANPVVKSPEEFKRIDALEAFGFLELKELELEGKDDIAHDLVKLAGEGFPHDAALHFADIC